jgi:hypothetical protein
VTRILAGTKRGLIDVGTGRTLLQGAITALDGFSGPWWAVVDDHRIWVSEDVAAWTERTSIKGLRVRCVLGTGASALVGTSEAHLLSVEDGSATRVRSFDRVPTRDDWYTPWGGPADVRSLARGAGGRVYVNVHVGGILASDDGENDWAPTAMDIDADVHQVLAHPSDAGRAFAATAIGLAVTSNGGASWDFTEEGLHAAYCRAIAIGGNTLLLSASKSHTGRASALYRRALDGERFERCSEGLPEWFADNVDTHCLVASGDHAALGTSDGFVYASEDAGRTWSPVADGLGEVTAVALV